MGRSVFTAVALSLLLAACGGGGGSSSSSGGSSSSSGGGSGTRGEFTLSASSATFRTPDNGVVPAPVLIQVSVTGEDVQEIVAGFAPNEVPTWLSASVFRTGTNYTLVLQPGGQQTVQPTRSATVTVTSRDSARQTMRTREVRVTLDTFAGLRILSDLTERDYVFGTVATEVVNLDVSAAGRTWQLSSDAPWVIVPSGTRTGSATIPVTINVAAMNPFDFTLSHVTITNVADPDDRDVADLLIDVMPPQFTVTPASLTLGGPTGVDPLTVNATLTLGTAALDHPWTAQLEQVSVASHLTPTAGGFVGGNTPATFTLTGNGATLPPGAYTGNVRFAVTVFGRQFTRSVPLTVNRETQRLFPRANGIAFSSFPGGAMLTRQIRIDESYGRSGIPWNASTSVPWLDISPSSGVTGDTLTITASPGALTADQFHAASITLSSSHPRVERSETIRVGLWKGSVDPVAAAIPFTILERDLVANPVEPLVYLLGSDGVIRVHHAHTGANVATFTPGVGDYGALAISDDGRRIFVSDREARRTLELDSVTGVMQREYRAPLDSGSPSHLPGPQMLVSRLNGHPVLYPPFTSGRDPVYPIDLETGQPLQGYTEGGSRYDSSYLSSQHGSQLASADGEYHYRVDRDRLEVRHIRFSTLRGPSLMFVSGPIFQRSTRTDDFCVAADDTVLQADPAVGIHVLMKNLEFSPFAPLAVPQQVFSLRCGWTGRVYAVMSAASDTAPNLAVFDGRTAVGTLRLGPVAGQIFSRPLLSGDGRRIIWVDSLAGVKSLRIDAAP